VSIFITITHFLISGECGRIEYIIKIIILNIIEIVILIFLFGDKFYSILPIIFYNNIYYIMYFLYFIIFIYNNIITIIRCNYIRIKRNDFFLPKLQLLKLVFLAFIVIIFEVVDWHPYWKYDIWKYLVIHINVINIIQIVKYSQNEGDNIENTI
jgi:hypothetical protein